jgi:hypothetical protein
MLVNEFFGEVNEGFGTCLKELELANLVFVDLCNF